MKTFNVEKYIFELGARVYFTGRKINLPACLNSRYWSPTRVYTQSEYRCDLAGLNQCSRRIRLPPPWPSFHISLSSNGGLRYSSINTTWHYAKGVCVPFHSMKNTAATGIAMGTYDIMATETYHPLRYTHRGVGGHHDIKRPQPDTGITVTWHTWPLATAALLCQVQIKLQLLIPA